MPSFSGNLQHQAVGKTESWPATEKIKSCGYHIGLLDSQALVIQQHIDSCDKLVRGAFVYRSENPHRLGKRQKGYPCPPLDESVCCGCLARVIARDQADQNVRVNGVHTAAEPISEFPLLDQLTSGTSEPAEQITRGEYLRRKIFPNVVL